MKEIGKILITLGSIMLVVGLFLILGLRIPFLGKLPGDILIEKENFRFYFPLTSGILVSLFLTLVINLVIYLWRK